MRLLLGQQHHLLAALIVVTFHAVSAPGVPEHPGNVGHTCDTRPLSKHAGTVERASVVPELSYGTVYCCKQLLLAMRQGNAMTVSLRRRIRPSSALTMRPWARRICFLGASDIFTTSLASGCTGGGLSKAACRHYLHPCPVQDDRGEITCMRIASWVMCRRRKLHVYLPPSAKERELQPFRVSLSAHQGGFGIEVEPQVRAALRPPP